MKHLYVVHLLNFERNLWISMWKGCLFSIPRVQRCARLSWNKQWL